MRSEAEIYSTILEKAYKLEAENAQLKAEVTQLNGILRNSGWGQGEIDSAAYTEETIAQLKAELAQAKLSYDGAVAAHHEAKSQYRDLIEAHRRELAGWEAAHVALDRELGESKAREERLREALRALYALVKGECPSLLRDDSGGDAVLDCAIEAVLKEAGTCTMKNR